MTQEEEIKESLVETLIRLKMILVNARDSYTPEGFDVLVLVAIRAVEQIEKTLGMPPIAEMESFLRWRRDDSGKRGNNQVNNIRKIFEKTPEIPIKKLKKQNIEEVLPCGRIKSVCEHTRARKPHKCRKYTGEECYANICRSTQNIRTSPG